jgi:formylglycine-generating enzyme required for sulfatase activity
MDISTPRRTARASSARRTGARLITASCLALATICTSLTPARAVTIDWVTVGDPGNAPGWPVFGAVSEEFRIGKYEVTIGQYTEFLNAAAKSDPYSLYAVNMVLDNIAGISRSGSSGSYSYSVIGSGNRPITHVSWFDAARFANWMQNGQGSGSTETGAYTLSGATTGTAPARNAGAQFYIPTEDQWVKAAYYKGSGTNAGYWNYATQSDTAPGNTIGSGANQANYYLGVYPDGSYSTGGSEYSVAQGYLTDVGAFTNSPGSYGTFDMNGNVSEWNDVTGESGLRGIRGGSWSTQNAFNMSMQVRIFGGSSEQTSDTGFRLASPVAVPEPSTWAMGLAGLAYGGFSLWRRRKAKAALAVALVSFAVAGGEPVLAGPVSGPMADVVFGNLGASGNNALGGLSTSAIDAGPDGTRIAVSFVTGSDGPWPLGSLRLGIGSPTNDPVPFAFITGDDGGVPSMSTVAAFYYIPGEGNSVTTTGLYDFTLASAAELQASTNYWLFVGDDSPNASSFGWYGNAAAVSPTAQNDSGWSFGATKISFDGGSTWGGYSAGNSVAFSIAAVPEPSTYALTLAGIACAGWHVARRQKTRS